MFCQADEALTLGVRCWMFDIEHPVRPKAHLKDPTEVGMRPHRWTVVAKTSPPDLQAAREQERWLKLGDDALSNRKINTDDQSPHLLHPGERARTQLKAVARELKNTLRKYLK